jgi:hypothetical protein
MTKTFSARTLIQNLNFDIAKKLENNESSEKIFKFIKKKLITMEHMEFNKCYRIRWD